MTDLKTLRPYFDRLADDALVGAQGRTRTPAPLVLASQDESADVIVVDIPRTPHGRTGRWRLAVAAAAVAALIVATILLVRTASDDGGTVLTPAGPAPSAPAPAPSEPSPTPLGAPLVEGPDAASTVLTSWGEFHVGYVFIYADGRVLWYPDSGAVLERRLSPRGLDLVRAGRLDPEYFLGHSILRPPFPRKRLWAERNPRKWEPSKYALCPYQRIAGGGVSLNATDVVDELPAPVQAVLDGKQRIYDPSIGTAHWEFPGTSGHGMTDCFELTATEVSNLYRIFLANGQIIDVFNGSTAWAAEAGRVALSPSPIYPHGQHVIWGG